MLALQFRLWSNEVDLPVELRQEQVQEGVVLEQKQYKATQSLGFKFAYFNYCTWSDTKWQFEELENSFAVLALTNPLTSTLKESLQKDSLLIVCMGSSKWEKFKNIKILKLLIEFLKFVGEVSFFWSELLLFSLLNKFESLLLSILLLEEGFYIDFFSFELCKFLLLHKHVY